MFIAAEAVALAPSWLEVFLGGVAILAITAVAIAMLMEKSDNG